MSGFIKYLPFRHSIANELSLCFYLRGLDRDNRPVGGEKLTAVGNTQQSF